MDFEALKAHGRRARHQLGRPLTIGGRSYRVRGYFANRLASDLDHEPQLTPVFRRALEARSGALVDVGANTGQTLLRLLSIAPSRRYVGFEPLISCCHAVHQFIEDNAMTNAVVLPVALSDENAVIPFYALDPYDLMATMAGNMTDGKPALVQARIGDEVLAELEVEEISVLKIDGGFEELRIMHGLELTISAHRPWLFFEVLPNFEWDSKEMMDDDMCERNRGLAKELYTFLSEAGYRMELIRDQGGTTPVEHFELDDRSAFVGFNYVAIPAP